MDDYLRALHRRWISQPGDMESAMMFLHAFSRSESGEFQGPNPLDVVLIDLLLSHCDEDGVDTHTNNATYALLRILYGQDASSLYLKYVDAVDNRWFFGATTPGHIAVIDQFMNAIGLVSPHSENCDRNDANCHVRGCRGPGCHVTTISFDGSMVNTELCYHHNQIATTNIDQFWELFTLDPQ